MTMTTLTKIPDRAPEVHERFHGRLARLSDRIRLPETLESLGAVHDSDAFLRSRGDVGGV